MRSAVETEANRVGAILVRGHPGKSRAIQFAISEGADTQQGRLWTTDAAEATHYDDLCRTVKAGSVFDWESQLWVKATSHSVFLTYRTQQKNAKPTQAGFGTKVRRVARRVLVSAIFLGAVAYIFYGRKVLKDELGILVWPLKGLYVMSIFYVLVVAFGFFLFYGLDRLYSLYKKLLPNRVPHYGRIEKCKEAAISGDARAQFALGCANESGDYGLPQDYAESVKWFRKAAEQNHYGAQLRLGIYLGEARGVERNVVEGLMWIVLANLVGALQGGGYLFRDGAHQASNRLRAQMTEQQIAESEVMLDASPLYKKLNERWSAARAPAW